MIIVDTSVVIDFLRTADPKLLGLFRAHDAAICGSHVRKFCTALEIRGNGRDLSHPWILSAKRKCRIRSGTRLERT
jgi:hypothetical protein